MRRDALGTPGLRLSKHRRARVVTTPIRVRGFYGQRRGGREGFPARAGYERGD